MLVVEDCEASARLAMALLAKLGAVSANAVTGAAAIEALRTESFDAVLMDCGLPDIDGYETTRRIRAGLAGSDRAAVPVIAFTADSDAATLALCREAGMGRVLAKPIVVAELKSLLAELAGVASAPASALDRPDGTPTHRIVSGEPALFDALGLLERVLNDQAIAHEVLEGFIATLPAQIDELQRSVNDAACQRTAALAHQLKGAAGGVGAGGLREVALAMEAAGHAGDMALLRRLASSLDEQSNRFRSAVRSVDLNAVAQGRREWTPIPKPARDLGAAGSVLLVDDDPTLRGMLRLMIEREGHRVTTAACAAEAMRALEREGIATFDCIVSDYRMPGESGLDLLTWIRSKDPTVATIMMTADDEKGVVTSSLRVGACDFLEKPVDARRLHAAIVAGVTRTREQRRARQAQTEVAAMGETQEQMLHTQAGCATPVELCFHPKLDAGGDFFSQFQLSADRTFCLLTDVSGHDLQAAYLSAYFHGMARGMLERAATPPALFAFFNRFLVKEWNPQRAVHTASNRSLASVAVSSLLIDTERGTIESLTAGAPAPSRVTEEGRIEVVGERGGAPLGWFDDCPASTNESTLAGGGSMLLWSDGLDDLAQAQQACVLATAFALQSARRIGTAHPLVHGAADDILVARVSLPPHTPFEDAFAPLVLWRYRGDQAAEIDGFAAYWRRSLRLAIPDLSDASEHDIVLATREALLNAMDHGCCGRADLRASLQISYRPRTRTLRVWIDDPGPGHTFDYAAYAEAAANELLTEHRGLIFIHNLANAVRYERNGASIRMDFHLADPPA